MKESGDLSNLNGSGGGVRHGLDVALDAQFPASAVNDGPVLSAGIQNEDQRRRRGWCSRHRRLPTSRRTQPSANPGQDAGAPLLRDFED